MQVVVPDRSLAHELWKSQKKLFCFGYLSAKITGIATTRSMKPSFSRHARWAWPAQRFSEVRWASASQAGCIWRSRSGYQRHLPSTIKLYVCRPKDENVVNPPQTPTISSCCSAVLSLPLATCRRRPENAPISKEPTTFTTSVPNGNVSPKR
jgi:hypothetical protein